MGVLNFIGRSRKIKSCRTRITSNAIRTPAHTGKASVRPYEGGRGSNNSTVRDPETAFEEISGDVRERGLLARITSGWPVICPQSAATAALLTRESRWEFTVTSSVMSSEVLFRIAQQNW